jgi:hypothetical protein
MYITKRIVFLIENSCIFLKKSFFDKNIIKYKIAAKEK